MFSLDIPTEPGFYWLKFPCGHIAGYKLIKVNDSALPPTKSNPNNLYVEISKHGYVSLSEYTQNQDVEFATAVAPV